MLFEFPNGAAIPKNDLNAIFEFNPIFQCLIYPSSVLINWEYAKPRILFLPNSSFDALKVFARMLVMFPASSTLNLNSENWLSNTFFFELFTNESTFKKIKIESFEIEELAR